MPVTRDEQELFHAPSVRIAEDGEGIVRITRRGDISPEEGLAFQEAMEGLLSRSSLRILADVREAGEVPVEVRRMYYRMAERVPDTRVALVGAKPYTRVVMNFILRMTNRIHATYFENEVEAVAWLRGGK